jgi:hypothetical protein
MKCAAAIALFVGLLAASAPAARAQEDDYATLIREALVEYNSGNWAEAHLLFQRAHALRPSARTLRGMGLANYERRSYVAAIRDLDASLASTESPLSAEQRATTERALARAREYVAIYTLEVPAGVAVLIVDGQRTPLAEDLRISLDPGKHVLSVKTQSGETIEREIEATAGARRELVFEAGSRGAGESEGAAAAGDRAGDPAASEDGGLLWTWVAGGATVLLGGGTVAFGLLASGENDDFVRLRDECAAGMTCRAEEKAAAKSRGQDYQLLTNVGIGVTAAAAAATLALYFIESSGEREPSAVTVSAAPGFVAVRGSF